MAKSHRRRFGFYLLGAFLLVGGQPLLADSPTTAPATQPSTDAVDQFLTAHQYAAALKMANKLAYLNNSTGAGVDPYQIDMLKGEAYIGTKATDAAIDAFKAAANATSDPHELAVAKSTILLLKNSNTTTYIPKTAPAGGVKPGPIPLADRDQRTAAFAALLDDQLSAMQPKIDAASKSANLQPVFPLLKQLADMKDLDQLANGNNDRTTKIAAGLLDHAHNMIAAALKGMWGRLDEINTSANQTITSTQINPVANAVVPGGGNVTNVQKAGLSDDNRTELRNMIGLCNEIRDAANVFMAMATSDKDKEWAAVISDSARVIGRANDLLNFVFTPTYSLAPTNYLPVQGYYPPSQIVIIGSGQLTVLPQIPTTNPSSNSHHNHAPTTQNSR